MSIKHQETGARHASGYLGGIPKDSTSTALRNDPCHTDSQTLNKQARTRRHWISHVWQMGSLEPTKHTPNPYILSPDSTLLTPGWWKCQKSIIWMWPLNVVHVWKPYETVLFPVEARKCMKNVHWSQGTYTDIHQTHWKIRGPNSVLRTEAKGIPGKDLPQQFPQMHHAVQKHKIADATFCNTNEYKILSWKKIKIFLWRM